jgi:hypothetical protein
LDNRADKYRQHAIDCLEAAQAVSDQRIRANLVAVAQSWQRLAEQADRANPI